MKRLISNFFGIKQLRRKWQNPILGQLQMIAASLVDLTKQAKVSDDYLNALEQNAQELRTVISASLDKINFQMGEYRNALIAINNQSGRKPPDEIATPLCHPLTKAMVEGRLFSTEPFTLVDVGASGGISSIWSTFGNDLRAFAFEPLLNECDRLNGLGTLGVEYIPALVGGPPASDGRNEADSERWDNRFGERTSTELALRILRRTMTSYYSQQNHAAEKRVTIDQFVTARQIQSVDFIKIDTDGSDFDVLLGSERTLADTQVLGIMIECEFHGPRESRANTFANVDNFLRAKGFSLADLQIYRYSRAALPSKFIHNFPSGTEQGQIKWADAIYFRDLAAPGYTDFWKFKTSQSKVMKLACLYEIFNLEDCAAELLLTFRDIVGAACDVEKLLNLLTLEQSRTKKSYTEYIETFNRDPEVFYSQSSE